jgi:hypothetical protein
MARAAAQARNGLGATLWISAGEDRGGGRGFVAAGIQHRSECRDQ